MRNWFPKRLRGCSPRGIARLGGALCLGALLALAALLAVPVILSLFGYRAYVVYGGSMGSALANGSVAVTRAVDSESLEVGDIIAIAREGRDVPLLHRIVEVKWTEAGTAYVTRGDSNHTVDPEPVVLQGRGDKVAFVIPYLGYLVHFTRGALGRLLLVLVPSLLLLGSVVWHLRRPAAPAVANGEPKC